MAVRWRQDSGVYRKYLQNIVVLYQSRQDLRLFTELLLSIATIVIFGLFAIKPTLVTIAELISEQKAKNETIATMDQKIENLVAAQTLFETEKTRIDILGSAIPQSPEPDHYVRHVEGIAQKNSATLMGFVIEAVPLTGAPDQGYPNPETLLTPDTTPFFTAAITASGTYTNLLGFLKDLESMRRPLYTESVQITAIEGSQNVEIHVIAKGKVPYYPEETGTNR